MSFFVAGCDAGASYPAYVCRANSRPDKLAHRAMAPDATTTSHPLTPQLTDAVYAGSQLPSLNPDPDPVTAPAGDTSNQRLRWLIRSGH